MPNRVNAAWINSPRFFIEGEVPGLDRGKLLEVLRGFSMFIHPSVDTVNSSDELLIIDKSVLSAQSSKLKNEFTKKSFSDIYDLKNYLRNHVSMHVAIKEGLAGIKVLKTDTGRDYLLLTCNNTVLIEGIVYLYRDVVNKLVTKTPFEHLNTTYYEDGSIQLRCVRLDVQQIEDVLTAMLQSYPI